MAERVLVLETQLTRGELRAMGLRVYGDRHPTGGHFVSLSALMHKLADIGCFVDSTCIQTPNDGSPNYLTCDIRHIDGTRLAVGTGAVPAAVTPAPGTYKATWGNVNGGTVTRDYRNKLVTLINNILIPVINRNVSITVPHSGRADLNEDPKLFTIHIWSSPWSWDDADVGEEDWHSYDPPVDLWGLELPVTDALNLPLWTDGTPVVSPENDDESPIGAFDAGNLYIYADLCHRSSDTELEIFKNILESVAARYKGGTGTPASEDPAALRKEYVAMVAKRKEAQAKEYNDQLTQIRRDLANYNARIVEQIREERKVLKDMTLLESDDAYNPERFAAEYDRLITNPLIKRIKMSRGGMTVYTNMINVTDPRSGIEHEIGEMSIYIDIARYNVVTKNLTRRVNGLDPNMHAPHVFPDGQMCLGNMTEVIPRLIGAYQLADAAEMLLAILQTVNVDDAAGRKVDRWPRSAKQIEADKAKEAAKAAIKVDTTATIPADRAARPVRQARDILDELEDPVYTTDGSGV